MSSAMKRFWSNEEGSISMEFILWLPLLIFWIVFSLAAFLAMNNRLDAMNATNVIADILSREETQIDSSRVNDLRLLFNALLPTSSGPSQMRVSSIMMTSSGLEVRWTECFGQIKALEVDDLPSDYLPIMANLQTVVLVETFVPYIPIVGMRDHGGAPMAWGTPLEWRNRVFIRPRNVSKVEKTGDAVSPNCL